MSNSIKDIGVIFHTSLGLIVALWASNDDLGRFHVRSQTWLSLRLNQYLKYEPFGSAKF